MKAFVIERLQNVLWQNHKSVFLRGTHQYIRIINNGSCCFDLLPSQREQMQGSILLVTICGWCDK